MSSDKIPTLQLPTSDYDQMRNMNNKRLISVLRSAVLAPDRIVRFTPRPPTTHDAYIIRHQGDCITVKLCAEGSVIFRCIFTASREEY